MLKNFFSFLFASLPFKGLTFYPVAAVSLAIPEAAELEGSTLLNFR